ncbi:MAG: hypothetical protein K9M75_11355 [Phycisphaerae bacterium]|nr:hypothetical protein [Phycisphaerae bacterium]
MEINSVNLESFTVYLGSLARSDQFVETELSHSDICLFTIINTFDDTKKKCQIEQFHAAVHVSSVLS